MKKETLTLLLADNPIILKNERDRLHKKIYNQ